MSYLHLTLPVLTLLTPKRFIFLCEKEEEINKTVPKEFEKIHKKETSICVGLFTIIAFND